MTKTRLLYLKSINDAASLRDVEYLQKSPHFADFDIRACYAIEMSRYRERGLYDVPYIELVALLQQEIMQFAPHKLLLHTGIAFRHNPAAFLQALAIIKYENPSIEMLYEPRHKHPASSIDVSDLLSNNDLFSGKFESPKP